ncbi:hypothetical protein JOQ06_025009, partial [Pogonophryne albipinna]
MECRLRMDRGRFGPERALSMPPISSVSMFGSYCESSTVYLLPRIHITNARSWWLVFPSLQMAHSDHLLMTGEQRKAFPAAAAWHPAQNRQKERQRVGGG